jgi:hypothetical protein
MIPTPATLWASIKAAKMAITLAVIGTLLVLLAIQTVRLEGLSVWPVKIEGWKARANRFEAALDLVAEAQITARAAQQAAMDAEQARYDELAERTDANARLAQVEAMDAANRYIERNRVRPPSGSVASTGSAAPQGDGAGVPENLPAHPFVAVSDADVRACTVAATYAVEAHNWAAALERGVE